MRNLKKSIVRELEIFFCISGKRVSVAYIVVSSELRSLRCRDLFLWKVLGVRVFEILESLSKWERHVNVIRPWYVMRKTFLYMSIHGDHAWPRRTLRLLHSMDLMVNRCFNFLVGMGHIRRLWGRPSCKYHWFIKDPPSPFYEVNDRPYRGHPLS